MKNTKRLHKIISLLTVGMLSISILAPTYGYSIYPRDIIGHWAEKDLIESKNKGIIGGYPDGTMKPNGNVTKAEAVKIINKSFGITGNTNTNSLKYTDVKSDAWYAVDVAIALDNGYLSKVAPGTKLFPNSPATREELASMITEAMGKKSESDQILDNFKDRDAISKTFVNSMATAVNMGLFGGYEDNTIRPQAPVTRGIMSAVINRAAGNINPNGIHTIEVGANDILIERNGSYYSYREADNIWISSKLGEGSTELNTIKTKTKMVVQGGGTNTIKLSGETKIPTVYLEKENSGVALEINKDSIVGNILVNAGDYGRIIGNAEKLIINTPGVKIDLEGSRIKYVEINSPNVELYLDRSTRIEKLVINKGGNGAKVTGSGRIDKVIVNANDCKIDVTVTDIEVGDGITGTTNKGEDILSPDTPYISSGNIDIAVDSTKGSVTVSVRVKNPGTSKANIDLSGSKEYTAGNLSISKDGVSSYTFTNVAPGNYKAKVSVSKAKAESDTFTVDTTENALINAKASAKKEIQNDFNRYNAKDYSSLNWGKLEKAKTDGEKAVDISKTLAAVTQARDNAINSMAKVPTKIDEDAGPLGSAKRTAISEIESAYKNYDKELYNEKQLGLLLEAKERGIEDIYNSSTAEEIKLVKADALKAMANVKTTLMVVKTEAKDALKLAYESYDKNLYSTIGLNKLADIVSTGNQKIDSSSNSVEVDKYKTEALKALDEVLTRDEEIADGEFKLIESKENSKKEIQEKYDYYSLLQGDKENESDSNAYTLVNWKKIELAYNNGITNINNAPSISEVEKIKDSTIKAMESILNKAQETLALEKTKAKSELSLYRNTISDDYTSTEIAKLNTIQSEGNLSIDNSQTIEGVNGSLALAKSEMENVRQEALSKAKLELKTTGNNAIGDLNITIKGYNKDNYSDSGWNNINKIYGDAKAEIEKGVAKGEGITITPDSTYVIRSVKAETSKINPIKSKAISDMASVKTISQDQEITLNAAKESAKKDLQAQYDIYRIREAEYGDTWFKITAEKEQGDLLISSALTAIEAIDEKNNAILKMETASRNGFDGLEKAIKSAQSYLTTKYSIENYFNEDWLNQLNADLTAIINEIALKNLISEVEATKTSAELTLDSKYKTKIVYREEGIKELKTHYDALSKLVLTSEQRNNLSNIYNLGISNINKSVTKTELNTIKEKAIIDMYNGTGQTPPASFVQPIVVPANATLSQKTAIQSISTSYTQLDPMTYSVSAWNEVEEIKSTSVNKIMEAKTSTEIANVKNTGISALNQVQTLAEEEAALNKAKASAKAEFSKTASSYVMSSYSTTNWANISQIKLSTEKAISGTTSIEGVIQAKDKGLVQLKAVKTKTQEASELSNAKIAGKKELTVAYSKYNKANYTTANWSALTKAKTNGDTAINNAKTLTEVNKAKQIALNAMANVKRK